MPKERFTTLKQLWYILTPYWKHEKKLEAWTLSAIALSLLLIYSAANAFKTFIPKWLVNALAAHDSKLFYQMLLLGVIMLSISVPIETFNRYLIDKLGVSWRRWFNTDLLVRYLQNKAI